jgi:hypothetical protein
MSQYGDINVMVNWCTRQKVGNVWQNFVILLMKESNERESGAKLSCALHCGEIVRLEYIIL